MRFNPRAFQTAQDVAAAVALESVHPIASSGQDRFILAYGLPAANRVPVPEHITGVTLCLRHNDSASQVDHFDAHANLGCPEFLLLLSNDARSESLARRALSLVSSLHSLDWTWHTERHTGGHGNYLQSSPFSLPPSLNITSRRMMGGPITTVFWEIEFTRRTELWPHRCFGTKPIDRSPIDPPIAPAGQALTAVFKLNAALNGVEIHFSRRPTDADLTPIRAQRWRYNGATKCWWSKQNPASLAFAAAFTAQFNDPDYKDQASIGLEEGNPPPAISEVSPQSPAQPCPHGVLSSPQTPTNQLLARPVRQVIRFTP